MWLRSRLTASPPFCPARRASADENSCAVPRLWAARPPSAAIARWRWSLIPAKPRPRLEEPRAAAVRRPTLAVVAFRERVREPRDWDFVDRALLERERLRGLFELDGCDLLSPFSRRILFTVRPDFLALCSMC